MSSATVALDVVLLLPEPFARPLTAVNATLAPPPVGFRFDATHVPHITLVQQFVASADVDQVMALVDQSLQGVHTLEIETTDLATGGTTPVLRVARTAELHTLHSVLMNQLQPVEQPHGDGAAFVVDGEAARPSDVRWVTGFRDTAAYDHFDPHITLGVGSVTAWTGPTRTRVSRVAVCQLGRFCTCRRVLREWSLTPPSA